MSSGNVSRRTILGAGAAGIAAGTFGISTIANGAQRKGRRAKNIILCVSDGMCASIPSMVDHLAQLNGKDNSYWGWLMKQPFTTNGIQDTRSLNSVVTDSSAASSSWGSGRHIWNGQVNMYPDGTELRTLVNLMQEAGLRTGLVTTATVTHATPAGFAVNCVQRDLEPLIAEKYLKQGVNVLMGGGDRFFSAEGRKDKRDLYGDFAKAGYLVVKDRDGVLKAKGDRILGIFSPSHVPFTVDRDSDPALQAKVPTLAEMATVAIENLNKKGKGFLLQIEGAKIDHAAHGSDLAAALYDQIAFEEAVKVAVDFALKDGNTLVIVTSDHGTGGPQLNGAGDEYIESTAGLLTVNKMKSSYGPLMTEIGVNPNMERVRDAVEAKLGIQLKQEDAQAIADIMGGKNPFAASMFYGGSGIAIANVLGNYSKVTWTSGNHTSERVLVTALGPGRESFNGLVQNTSFFDIILGQHGISWSNPTTTFEQARRDYQKLRAEVDRDFLAHYSAPRDPDHLFANVLA